MNLIPLAFVMGLMLNLVSHAGALASRAHGPVKNQTFQETGSREASAARTLERFQRIKRRMSMKEVIRLCGEPDGDIGSGIHIYVYELTDGSVVRVGTPDNKRIMYVVQVLKNGEERPLLRSR